nr:MAG TPA: hypothetical protein [Caudoviricetes sp.]
MNIYSTTFYFYYIISKFLFKIKFVEFRLYWSTYISQRRDDIYG